MAAGPTNAPGSSISAKHRRPGCAAKCAPSRAGRAWTGRCKAGAPSPSPPVGPPWCRRNPGPARRSRKTSTSCCSSTGPCPTRRLRRARTASSTVWVSACPCGWWAARRARPCCARSACSVRPRAPSSSPAPGRCPARPGCGWCGTARPTCPAAPRPRRPRRRSASITPCDPPSPPSSAASANARRRPACRCGRWWWPSPRLCRGRRPRRCGWSRWARPPAARRLQPPPSPRSSTRTTAPPRWSRCALPHRCRNSRATASCCPRTCATRAGARWPTPAASRSRWPRRRRRRWRSSPPRPSAWSSGGRRRPCR